MKFKAETFIGLSILVAVGLVIGIFFSLGSGVDKSAQEYTPEKVTPVEERKPLSDFTKFVSMGENICEGCHLSGKKFIPQAYEVKEHVEGGAYCLKCHTIDHNAHPINDNVTCEKCHGSAKPQVPEYTNGKIVCEECHDYPDPLVPSEGNIVVVHRPRNVGCTDCHTDSCLKCHDKIGTDEKWNKRLTHFNALLTRLDN
jgi:hypothetical protein